MALFGAWTFSLLISCITFFLVLRWRRKPKDGNLPPSPFRLPWLGNLLQVDIQNLFMSLYRLQEQYGPVFTVYMGPQPVVVLCGYEAIKEALVDNAEVFGGRARMLGMDDTMQNYGIGSSNGERWKELRNFCQSALRNFGVGKRSMEERIQEEAEFLVEALRKTEAKIHEEIDQVIGRNRRPCMDDRKKMPYTDAVIHEIHRYADVSPIGIPHLVTRDTQFRGYTIPKDTTVILFLTTALEDPCYFETPKKFNPAHFLDKNGDFRKNEAFLPFSAGKRVCLGENLARMEIFLFLTTVLQNFNLRTLQDREEIDILPEVHSSGKLPQPYQLSVVPR
ncbi:hypothetical protein JD844_006083 [Phrynosoma platyrhinos]|uniref:Uncharacterized protein n=1 Tax=Phrynosoma platyrhinos TaxID=52577 RepID=A0ABQ7TPA6_PHRPL|nr:hypothetical protein JD844_006083 [Phrynosoma platyrhinos]